MSDAVTVRVEFLLPSEQRYFTAGDWQREGDEIRFRITRTGNSVYDRLVLLHEMVEQLCCEVKGITEKDVDDFDFSHTGERDPGDCSNSPYRNEHNLATAVERLLTAYLGISWQAYDQTVLGEGP